MIYPLKFPSFISFLFPSLINKIKTDKKEIFLSFDDGPNEVVTPWVLDQLKKHNAKATFFCLGENIALHPDLIKRIKTEGHAMGNHTYHHKDGWKTKKTVYFNEIKQTQRELMKNGIHTKLFRPPYGRISFLQIHKLNKDYKIIMWTYLSGDYSSKISPEAVAERLVKKVKKGDILVFHDSPLAYNNLRIMLPLLLKKLSKRGYIFQALYQ